jgi:hypothetical protein
MEIEQLISEVKKRPVLWGTSALYENFSNNTQTEKKVIGK